MTENWTFVRTLQFELGIDVELAERIEQLVQDSSHFYTPAHMQEAWNEADTIQAKLEEVIENQDEEINMLLRYIEGLS